MHGQNHIKFVCAKQAKTIHEYKSLKRRLYKITTAIWYNKTCREKHLTPKYISIKTNYFLHFYSTKYHRQQPLYNTLELLMMGIVVSETC